MLSINIGIDAHTQEYSKTSKHSSKFGESNFDEQLVGSVEKIVKDQNKVFSGIRCHFGSQNFDTKAFHEGSETMIGETKKIAATLGVKIPEINLGGGFGVYYTENDVEVVIVSFMRSMIEHFEKSLDEHKLEIEAVSIVPG